METNEESFPLWPLCEQHVDQMLECMYEHGLSIVLGKEIVPLQHLECLPKCPIILPSQDLPLFWSCLPRSQLTYLEQFGV